MTHCWISRRFASFWSGTSRAGEMASVYVRSPTAWTSSQIVVCCLTCWGCRYDSATSPICCIQSFLAGWLIYRFRSYRVCRDRTSLGKSTSIYSVGMVWADLIRNFYVSRSSQSPVTWSIGGTKRTSTMPRRFALHWTPASRFWLYLSLCCWRCFRTVFSRVRFCESDIGFIILLSPEEILRCTRSPMSPNRALQRTT
jgi:hypothetical protein